MARRFVPIVSKEKALQIAKSALENNPYCSEESKNALTMESFELEYFPHIRTYYYITNMSWTAVKTIGFKTRSFDGESYVEEYDSYEEKAYYSTYSYDCFRDISKETEKVVYDTLSKYENEGFFIEEFELNEKQSIAERLLIREARSKINVEKVAKEYLNKKSSEHEEVNTTRMTDLKVSSTVIESVVFLPMWKTVGTSNDIYINACTGEIDRIHFEGTDVFKECEARAEKADNKSDIKKIIKNVLLILISLYLMAYTLCYMVTNSAVIKGKDSGVEPIAIMIFIAVIIAIPVLIRNKELFEGYVADERRVYNISKLVEQMSKPSDASVRVSYQKKYSSPKQLVKKAYSIARLHRFLADLPMVVITLVVVGTMLFMAATGPDRIGVSEFLWRLITFQWKHH